MERRAFLAGAGTVAATLLAGCVDPGARLDMEQVSDAALAERASRSVARAPQETREVVSDAVANGSATVSGFSPPLETDRPVRYDGGFFAFEYSVVDTRQRRSWAIEVDYDPPADATGATVAYADLPEVDRAVLSSVIPPSGDHPESEGVDIGVTHVYGPEGEAASVLVPTREYEFVTYDGERYRVRVEGPRAVTEETYRYVAERVAGSAGEYAAAVRAEYLFVLDGLSDAQRDIVAAAVDDSYNASEPSDAFASLEARFREHSGFGVDEYGGEWVVRYDGETYWAEVYSAS